MESDQASQPGSTYATTKRPSPRLTIAAFITAFLLAACSNLCGIPANVSYYSNVWGDSSETGNQNVDPTLSCPASMLVGDTAEVTVTPFLTGMTFDVVTTSNGLNYESSGGVLRLTASAMGTIAITVLSGADSYISLACSIIVSEGNAIVVGGSNQNVAPSPTPQPIRQPLPPAAIASDEPEDTSIDANLPNASLLSIGCLAGGQHLISFEFDQTISGGYIVTVGDQPFQLAPVPDQPTRLYFVGPTLFPNQQVEVRLLSPLGQTVFSQNYLLPACADQPAAPQATAQPSCPPPEFFDPLMNRCRIVGNEQPAQPEYSPPSDYTPPGDY